MRIDRIARIRNLGTFRDFTWPNDLTNFGRYNLIYGWNGTGKTLLSNIFRDLEKQDNVVNGGVTLTVDGRNILGDCFSEETVLIRVFNRDFVNENVFTTTGELTPIFVLGEANIEKQKQADQLKADLDAASTELQRFRVKKSKAVGALELFSSSNAKRIKEVLRSPGQSFYNDYDIRGFRSKAKKLEKAGDLSACKLDEEEKTRLLKQHTATPKEPVPAVAYNFPNLDELYRTVSEMLAQTVVSSFIKALREDTNLAMWVRDGLAKHKERHAEKCLFCDQSLPPNRIKSLETHFNDEYENFLQRINKKIEEVKALLRLVENVGVPDKARFYEDLVPEYDKAQKALQKELGKAKKALVGIQEGLELKRGVLYDTISLSIFIPELQPGTLVAVNTIIDRHNKTSDEFAKRLRSARQRLEAAYVADVLPEFIKFQTDVAQKELDLQNKGKAIAEHRKELSHLEREIVEHRQPADELNCDLLAYLGHKEITLECEETGYQITRGGEIAKGLSEGERTAIALLYFLKSLKDRRFSLGQGIVVLDDPVCSLDSNFIFSAFGFIKERTKNAGQLFVLTHNFTFFRQVRSWFHRLPHQRKKKPTDRPARFYMLECTSSVQGRVSVIRWLDSLLQEHDSEYHYLFRLVYDTAIAESSPNLEAYYLMPNVARRLLEAFLTFRMPHCAGNLHKQLELISCEECKKARILRFLHAYSHHEQIGDESGDLSILSETQPVLRDILKVMETADQGHYDAMKSLVSTGESTGEK